MITTSQLADALGRKQMAEALGVGLTSVSNAVVRGSFPSSWFLVVKAIADRVGQQCPPELFKMRLYSSQNVNEQKANQGSVSKKRKPRRKSK